MRKLRHHQTTTHYALASSYLKRQRLQKRSNKKQKFISLAKFFKIFGQESFFGDL